jgi:hypothetical protein
MPSMVASSPTWSTFFTSTFLVRFYGCICPHLECLIVKSSLQGVTIVKLHGFQCSAGYQVVLKNLHLAGEAMTQQVAAHT